MQRYLHIYGNLQYTCFCDLCSIVKNVVCKMFDVDVLCTAYNFLRFPYHLKHPYLTCSIKISQSLIFHLLLPWAAQFFDVLSWAFNQHTPKYFYTSFEHKKLRQKFRQGQKFIWSLCTLACKIWTKNLLVFRVLHFLIFYLCKPQCVLNNLSSSFLIFSLSTWHVYHFSLQGKET